MENIKRIEESTLQDLTIKNNFMFQQVMRNESICKRFLEKLLGLNIKKITYVGMEETIEHLPDSKAVRLDLYIEDDKQRIYDVEMQTSNSANWGLQKRTRYYQSILDIQTLAKGEDYSKLKDTIIIFVCDFDPFGKGKWCYTFRNCCKEVEGLELNDGTTKIFLNSKGDTTDAPEDMKGLLGYIDGAEPVGSLAKAIDDEVKNVKLRQRLEGEFMTYRSGYMDARIEGRAEGETIGKILERVSSVRMIMKKLNLSQSAAVDFLEIPEIERPAVLQALQGE